MQLFELIDIIYNHTRIVTFSWERRRQLRTVFSPWRSGGAQNHRRPSSVKKNSYSSSFIHNFISRKASLRRFEMTHVPMNYIKLSQWFQHLLNSVIMDHDMVHSLTTNIDIYLTVWVSFKETWVISNRLKDALRDWKLCITLEPHESFSCLTVAGFETSFRPLHLGSQPLVRLSHEKVFISLLCYK